MKRIAITFFTICCLLTSWGQSNSEKLTQQAQEAYAEYTSTSTDSATLTFYYDDLRASRPGQTYDLNSGNNDPGWYTDDLTSSITQAVFDPSFANARPTSTFRWFSSMSHIKSFTGLDNLNTSEVTNMAHMFDDCSGLQSLDLSHFNTEKVTDMSYMFYDCLRLTSLVISQFNTANVIDMSCMFRGCSNLPNLDLHNFDTSKVTSMQGMFGNLCSLKSLDLSSFNTSNVTDMSYMFEMCQSLKSINLSSFNTSSVVNMQAMFIACFELPELDLSSFNTINVKYMTMMFYFCNELTTVYAGRGWSTGAVEYSEMMFVYCYKIKGGQGTTYDEGHIDVTYAHIDGGKINPGYFTDSTTSRPGDVNNDGNVNIEDLTLLIDLLLNGSEMPINADVNGDGIVGIDDITTLIDKLLDED